MSFISRTRPAHWLIATMSFALPFAAACESSPTTTAPSGVLQVSTSAATLRAGDTATVTASVAGVPVAVVAWTSSDESVASVSVTGVVTGRRAGRVTITGSSGIAAGQAPVRVVPDFAGTWTGPLLRQLPICSPGSTAPVCVPDTGSDVLLTPVTLTVTQTGDIASGTLVDGLEPLIVVPLEGRVDTSDTLALDGRSPTATLDVSRRLTVSGLRATFDPSVDAISGAFSLLAEQRASGGAFVSDYSFQGQFRNFARR